MTPTVMANLTNAHLTPQTTESGVTVGYGDSEVVATVQWELIASPTVAKP